MQFCNHLLIIEMNQTNHIFLKCTISEFGEVVSVNNGFGFIQPYGEKEQAYYNHRDGSNNAVLNQ